MLLIFLSIRLHYPNKMPIFVKFSTVTYGNFKEHRRIIPLIY